MTGPFFDPDRLRTLAGDKVFARGVDYHRGGEVELLTVEPQRVLARVTGSEAYRCDLRLGEGGIEGHCSCPAFRDWGFCKHLVATALAANASPPEAVEAFAASKQRILAHLQAQGAEALACRLLALAEEDETLFRELELEAAASSEDDAALLQRFRRAIDAAVGNDYYIDYRAAGGWAEGVEAVLDRVAGLLEQGRARLVLQLLDHAIDRLEQAGGHLDDSDGHLGGLLHQVETVHFQACRLARPEPVALARWLFKREMQSDWEAFSAGSETHAEVLGEAGLAEYRRLAQAAWDALAPGSSDRYQLMAILDRFAARDGDLDTRIALRSDNLSSPYAYLQLAELCLAHDRPAEALRWAEEGVWTFEDRPDHRLLHFTAERLAEADRREDAAALLWQLFEQWSTPENYRRLKALAGEDAEVATAVRERAFALLRGRLATESPARSSWLLPAEPLLRLLMEEGRLEEAWEVWSNHGCSGALLESLAAASEETLPEKALEGYARCVEELVGSASGYQPAVALVERMGAIRRKRGEPGVQAAYVAELAQRHKRKRNFMALLRDLLQA